MARYIKDSKDLRTQILHELWPEQDVDSLWQTVEHDPEKYIDYFSQITDRKFQYIIQTIHSIILTEDANSLKSLLVDLAPTGRYYDTSFWQAGAKLEETEMFEELEVVKNSDVDWSRNWEGNYAALLIAEEMLNAPNFNVAGVSLRKGFNFVHRMAYKAISEAVNELQEMGADISMRIMDEYETSKPSEEADMDFWDVIFIAYVIAAIRLINK